MSRILVINPNASASVTAAIDAAVQPLRAQGGPTITVAGLDSGPPGIATQRDADSVVMPLLQRVARDDADAFVLAYFSDPGLHAVREAAGGRPVMGIAECGILRALTLGERFGIQAVVAAIGALLLNGTELLRASAARARALDVPITIHLAQSEAEVATIGARHGGRTPAEYLDWLGLLAPDLLAAHCSAGRALHRQLR